MNARANIVSLQDAADRRYNFRAQTDEAATIDIFGEIDEWWGYGVRAMAFDLVQNRSRKLNINIHSPGGSALEAIGIANLIKGHDAETTTTGIGFVASAATLPLLAADNVRMAENAFLMIHNPWTFAIGEADDIRKTADLLDKMANELAVIYQGAMNARGKKTTLEDVKALMAAETWYTAEEALDAGLIDEIVTGVEAVADEPEQAEAMAGVMAKYQNVPQALADKFNKFNNKNSKKMAKDKNSLFAQIGQLFVSAADELAADETKQETKEAPAATTDNTDATMTVEEAKKLLEREGFTVAQKADEKADEKEAAEVAELVALKAKVEELTNAIKNKVGAPSGGTAEQKTDGKKRPQAAMPFFDNLATVIKNYRQG